MEFIPQGLRNDWRIENGKLKLTKQLKDFMSCINKIGEIAKIAEFQNHHPNLCVTEYKNLSIEIYTHEKHDGVLTEKDLALARAIDIILI